MKTIQSILCPTASGKPATNIQYRVAFEWKLQDLWIGAFWKRQGNCVDLWICFVPCIPLHISWRWYESELNY